MRKIVLVLTMAGFVAISSVFTGCSGINKAIEDSVYGINDFMSQGDGVLEQMQRLGKCSGNADDPNCFPVKGK